MSQTARLNETSPRGETLATIHDAYRPIEQYLQRAESAGIAGAACIEPLDAFLMQQIAAYLPKPPTVIDLAADTTFGASTIFWASQPGVRTVIVPPGGGESAGCHWRSHVEDALAEMRRDRKRIKLSTVRLNGSEPWQASIGAVDRRSPLLVVLGVSEHTAAQIPSRLGEIVRAAPEAIILCFPFGPIGSTALGQVVGFCGAETPYRLIAMREMSPFFAASRLGIISHADHPDLRHVIKRLQQLFEGNFQFLPMVNTVITLTARDKDHQRATQEVREALTKTQEYAIWLESRLKHLEEEYIPWKHEYIENLETYLRNLSKSKALKVSNALRRIRSLRR